jgi:hypothetical protein
MINKLKQHHLYQSSCRCRTRNSNYTQHPTCTHTSWITRFIPIFHIFRVIVSPLRAPHTRRKSSAAAPLRGLQTAVHLLMRICNSWYACNLECSRRRFVRRRQLAACVVPLQSWRIDLDWELLCYRISGHRHITVIYITDGPRLVPPDKLDEWEFMSWELVWEARP